MSEDARFQSGDQCYATALQAAQAHLAVQASYVTTYDFGEGFGPVAAVVSPVQAHAGYMDEPGSLEYAVTGMYQGDQYQTSLSVAYYPLPCVLDEASASMRADANQMTMLFLGALVAIWGAKRLLALFSGDTDRG